MLVNLHLLQAVKFIDELLAIKTDKLGADVLLAAAKTSMGSKIVGAEGDFFAQMVVEAIQAVHTTDQSGRVRYPVRAINVLKANGQSSLESKLIKGYAVNCARAAQGMPTRVAPARIACLDMNLQKARLQMGVQVLVTDPKELEAIRQREADITKERVQKILDADLG
eukprot:GHRR01023407.1.p1 GENE.GHRR01023407.1~~GHRR01023407.1.p1  ORF type:complete len:167 (+),score=72.50 GHRR01023407.1:139-639(+)